MTVTRNEFMEMVGSENIGFMSHMFLDGVEYALGAISSKEKPTTHAMLKASNAIMATMFSKGLITEDKWGDTDRKLKNIYTISLDKD